VAEKKARYRLLKISTERRHDHLIELRGHEKRKKKGGENQTFSYIGCERKKKGEGQDCVPRGIWERQKEEEERERER